MLIHLYFLSLFSLISALKKGRSIDFGYRDLDQNQQAYTLTRFTISNPNPRYAENIAIFFLGSLHQEIPLG
jgi:hypothetical protein